LLLALVVKARSLGEAFPETQRADVGYRYARPNLLLALVVIVNLIEQAAALGLEWPVMDARRPAGIGRRLERLATLSCLVVADNEIALDDIHLLPVIVHERRRGVGGRLEPQA